MQTYFFVLDVCRYSSSRFAAACMFVPCLLGRENLFCSNETRQNLVFAKKKWKGERRLFIGEVGRMPERMLAKQKEFEV